MNYYELIQSRMKALDQRTLNWIKQHTAQGHGVSYPHLSRSAQKAFDRLQKQGMIKFVKTEEIYGYVAV